MAVIIIVRVRGGVEDHLVRVSIAESVGATDVSGPGALRLWPWIHGLLYRRLCVLPNTLADALHERGKRASALQDGSGGGA